MKKAISELSSIIESAKNESREISEAAPVTFKELPENVRSSIKKIEKSTGAKSYAYFSGMHGIIAEFKGASRFEPKQLKAIAAQKIRWFEVVGQGQFAIGF